MGGNLIYISNRIYPDFLVEQMRNKDQFCIDLKNSTSVGHSSLQSLESIIPPAFIIKEHQLLLNSFKELVGAMEDLLRSIELNTSLMINAADLEMEISKFKKIERMVKTASMEVIKKVNGEVMKLNVINNSLIK
ncbi:hypothetical protein [Peribacillus simplex]|uniref:hypothetical protein n=1 Tax=Peribacillus simplex TaxID=1478 RepID=UPI003D2871B1